MPKGIFEEYFFDCKTQVPCGSGASYNYECTVTFNPTLYTVGSAYNDGLPLVKESLRRWLEPTDADFIVVATEYQKNHMAHLHCLIGSENPLPITICANIVKGLQRIAGRSTFKPVIDLLKFEEYLQKDLLANYERSGICHYNVYFKL